MWRALSVARGDLVVFLDADTRDFAPHFATRHARAADLRAGRAVREGLLPAAVRHGDGSEQRGRRRPRHRADGAAAAVGLLPRAGRASSSRSPARWPRAATLLERSRSPPATRSRRRCCSTRATRSAAPTRWPRSTSTSATTATSRCATLGPMAYAVLRVVLERLRAEGRLLDDRRPRSRRPTAGSCRSSSWSGRRTPRSALAHSGASLRLHRPRRHAARPGRVALPRRRGQLHAARGARARGLPPRRRRGRDQVRAPARAGEGGRAPARPELVHLRGGRGRSWSTARRRSSPATSSRARARSSTSRSSVGRAALLLEHYAGRLESTRRGTSDREVSHLFRGHVDAGGQRAARAEGHADLRLVDNGEIAPRARTRFHLIPAEASKASAVAAHMRARGYAPRGVHRRSATRARTSRWPRSWAASSWSRTPWRRHARAANVERTEAGWRGLLRGRGPGAGRVAARAR